MDMKRLGTWESKILRCISKQLDRKMNKYIRGKMDAQDMILDEIT
jgi:hypothetical protein